METFTAHCEYCSRSFAGNKQSIKGIITKHERFCLRNPSNRGKQTKVETPGGVSLGNVGNTQQPSTLEELEKKLSGQDSSLILYECGSCKSRFSTLTGLKQHVAHCINSPVKKTYLQKNPNPSAEVTKTIKFTEEEALSTRSTKSLKEVHSEEMQRKGKREKKRLQAALQQRAATVASEVLQGKLQSKKKGSSKFQCEHCEASFLGKQSLDGHLKICKKRKSALGSGDAPANVQPFIAKIQQPDPDEPQDMIGLFIPIGLFPNSEHGEGLPDISSVTELMQRQSESSSGPNSSSDGAPPENIKKVMNMLPKNLKCEDCNKTFPPGSSIEEIEKHDCGQQTPQKLKVADGNKTETIVLDEVQCKYCLRTVNQRMDLIKHYRFCLGLKNTKKTAETQKKEDDSVYSLFSDEMRDEIEEQPVTPRRSARKRQQEAEAEAIEVKTDEAKRRRGRVYGRQEEGRENNDEVRADLGTEKYMEDMEGTSKTQGAQPDESMDAEPEQTFTVPDVQDTTPPVRQKVLRSKPPKGIVVEQKEEKTKWKTIYVVPPICPYCKMQFRAYSSLKMHYRFCFYRKKVEAEGTVPSMPELPREKDGVVYMWPEEAARLFYTKCNFCHKRFASERTRIRHMHTCSKRRAKTDEDESMSLADLAPTDKVRCTGCGEVTERSVFSRHLKGCRKHTKVHRPGKSTAKLTDENIKEGEDFLKEVTEEEKEGFLEKFGLLSKDSPSPGKEEEKVTKGSVHQNQNSQEGLEEGEVLRKARPSVQDDSGEGKQHVEKVVKETQAQLFEAAVQEADMYMNRGQEYEPESERKKITQSVKIFHKGESVPDPKKAESYHCPDCGVLVKSHDGLRSHKLFCDQVSSSLTSGEEKVEASNFKVPSKLTTDIMPDCIYHCGYCGGILKEGPQFKEHVMSCYDEIGQQNVDQNHEALLKEIQNYPEFNAKKEKIPQLMVLTSKQITDKADPAKVHTQPFLMFECTVCNKILNTQTMAAKHSNACQRTASKRERQEQKREIRREQETMRVENEKRKSIEQTLAKKCEEMGYIYECYDCGRRFVSKVNVSRHMPHCVGVRGSGAQSRERDNSVPGDITCKFCQRGFLNVGAMRSHLRYCFYRDLETRQTAPQTKTKIVVDGSGQATEYLEQIGSVEPQHEIEVHMECEEGDPVHPVQQEGEEEITFMVQVQRDDDEEEEQAQQEQPEEIVVQAVDLEGGQVSEEILAQLQQQHKVVGMGSYQYGDSEQPTRVGVKTTEAGPLEEEQEKVVISPNQVGLCMECGMIIQTEHGLLNHQKFCKQFNEAAKNVPQTLEQSKRVIVRTSTGQPDETVVMKAVSPRRSPRSLPVQAAATTMVSSVETVQQGNQPMLPRKVVKRKVFNQ